MMIKIPQEILKKFETLLETDNIAANRHNLFKKWLRYYLDFCQKYKHDPNNIDSLPVFINKLCAKEEVIQRFLKRLKAPLIYKKRTRLPTKLRTVGYMNNRGYSSFHIVADSSSQ
ncbi:MAG: hypothetical protein GY857_04070 [Desulfobacula sp.]|nr:hypothetical protein [Desulfobacula sp.]